MNKLPELLAPVGGWPHLTAAVSNGADAVYMGGSLFNARIFADNFTNEDLPEAVNYAHSHNVKVYVTLNTLIKDSELLRAFEYANFLYKIGVDAIIIQDMGLARLIHKYIPGFEMHLSTQGSLYNPEAIDLARELGFRRVVPARELTLTEISSLCAKCHSEEDADNYSDTAQYHADAERFGTDAAAYTGPIEVEVFVHGALCMCYSGQCQMSRALNTKHDGRSGNRGTCAQPCRHPYESDDHNISYALSTKDFCALESLPELIEAGVDSLKIEGRIKTPEYVAIVTRIYRKYLDEYALLLRNNDSEVAREAYSVSRQDMNTLKQAFNRGGFSSGYLYGNPGDDILSGSSPKNQGIYAGKIVAVIDSEDKVDTRDDKSAVRGALRRGRVLVCVEITNGELHPGDGIEFISDKAEFDTNPIGNVITYASDLGHGMYLVGDFEPCIRQGKSLTRLSIGDRVYKVTDRQLQASALNAPEKKLPVSISFTARIGQYITMTMTDVKSGFAYETVGDHIIEAATKSPTGEDRIIEQLCRLGNTPFSSSSVYCDVELDDNAMVPVSLINRMRRDAADALLDERLNGIKRSRKPLTQAETDVIAATEMLGASNLNTTVFTDKYAEGAVKPVAIEEFMEDPYSIIENNRRTGVHTLPYILNISKGNLDEYIRENFDAIVAAVENTGILIGNMGWIRQFQRAGVKIFGDYGLNIFNQQALKLYEEFGVEVYAPSLETGVCDSRGLPLMITEHPVNSAYLIDRKGAKHSVVQAPSLDKYMIY